MTTKNLRTRGRGNRIGGHSKGAPLSPSQKQPDTKTYSGRLAERIRELREAAGLSVDDVAKAMRGRKYKISAPTLYHWENGTRQPQLDAMPTLAKVLGVEVVDLFPAK